MCRTHGHTNGHSTLYIQMDSTTVVGGEDKDHLKDRQVSGDGFPGFPVFVNEFNDNMVEEVFINLDMLIGSSTIQD